VALPTSYLTSVKNLTAILDAIRSAQAPDKFTYAFLESLEFKSSSDRLISGVFKSLGFIDDTGKPTDRYFRYLDQTQSEKVMAEAIRSAYDDLFRVNVNAHLLDKQEVINKFKTLSQGKLGESVLSKMAMTFTALVKNADFETPPAPSLDQPDPDKPKDKPTGGAGDTGNRGPLTLGGLVYNIQIVLPESRDQAVYDALFQSLRRHLV
jgi:hypothetical protein